MKETVIISLTTWRKRIGNIPVVLDSIYTQTMLPDKVVLNLAYGEEIPEEVAAYAEKHGIEVYYTEDTKVYKKFIPTLKRYPEACVINIDDDCIYPDTMVADFMELHAQYPQFPISGNHLIYDGIHCHCGNASLTKVEYFGRWLDKIDADLMQHCTSSDIVFSYLAARNERPYIHTKNEYFTNVMQDNLGKNEGYTNNTIKEDGVDKSYAYLVERFGKVPNPMKYYVGDGYMAEFLEEIIQSLQHEMEAQLVEARAQGEEKVRASKAYRFGKAIMKPFTFFKR